MLQKKSSSEEDWLAYGLPAINRAYTEGKITFKEWVRLTHDWAVRVLAEQDEMLDDDLPDCPVDWHSPRSA